ncbi:MAG: hypothetical protein ACLFUJ_09210 [Phycisphaerae bacterium]
MAAKESSPVAGLWAVGVGLVLAISARGLDNLAARDVVRKQAEAEKRLRWYPEQRDQHVKKMQDAALERARDAYLHEWAFLTGTILLAVGLLITAGRSDGLTRIAAMAMVGVILFSIYIGGVAWLGSLVGTVRGLGGM